MLQKHHFTFVALLFILLLVTTNITAQNFSPQSKISLLTASPGDELYTTFGHSAIRIQDPVSKQDLVYNYGIFDFRTPNFYTKFIRGKLPYKLGLQRMNSFLRVYTRENRRVSERVINLEEEEKMAFINFLKENYKPENREYPYDFFYDNCATRIRDIAETELQGKFAYENLPDRKVTFRQLLDEFLLTMPWADFGIDLILGLEADKIADHRNQQFLPEYLESNLALGTVTREGVKSNFLGKSTEILPFQFKRENKFNWLNPKIIMSIFGLLVLALTYFANNQKRQNFFDYFLFILLGIMGCFFLFMWLGTDHQACYKNLNMLWANPLYLFLAPFAIANKWNWFWIFVIAFTVLLLITFPFNPQQYHLAFIPIFIIIIMRGVYQFNRSRSSSRIITQ